jgi:hypothetical protein
LFCFVLFCIHLLFPKPSLIGKLPTDNFVACSIHIPQNLLRKLIDLIVCQLRVSSPSPHVEEIKSFLLIKCKIRLYDEEGKSLRDLFAKTSINRNDYMRILQNYNEVAPSFFNWVN